MYRLYSATVLALLFATFSSGVFAMDNICTNINSDPDGDGWGWENQQSCRMPSNGQPTSGDCIDPDGDGWGWDGTQSCRISVIPTNPQPNPQGCLDPDGDGWGWDGTKSCRVETTIPEQGECIDPDGDGWGWNGVESCRLNVSPAFVAQPSDPEWIACNANSSLAAGETWGTALVAGEQQTVACFRSCSGSETAIAGVPGWFYDQANQTECAKTDSQNDPNGLSLYGLPIYSTGQQSSRQSFESELLYPLYEGDGIWQCSIESRLSNNQYFSSTGRADLQFDKSGSVLQLNSSNSGQWGTLAYRSQVDTRELTVKLYNDTYSLVSAFQGYFQLDRNTLTIYNNSLERLSCIKTNSVSNNPQLPTSVEAIEDLPNIQITALVNRPLNCQVMEALNGDYQAAAIAGIGYTSNDSLAGKNFQVIARSVFVDEINESGYGLNIVGVESTDAPLSSSYLDNGDGSLSTAYPFILFETVQFKNFGSVILAKSDQRSTGGDFVGVMYAMCTE